MPPEDLDQYGVLVKLKLSWGVAILCQKRLRSLNTIAEPVHKTE